MRPVLVRRARRLGLSSSLKCGTKSTWLICLCIKKRTPNTNIKDMGGAETRTNGDKISVHTYIITQNRFLTWKAIGGSKTNTVKGSAWHVFGRIFLSLLQNHIIADSGILPHHNLHAKPHGTVPGIFAFASQCASLASVINFAALLCDQAEEAPIYFCLVCLCHRTLTERERPITHGITASSIQLSSQENHRREGRCYQKWATVTEFEPVRLLSKDRSGKFKPSLKTDFKRKKGEGIQCTDEERKFFSGWESGTE